MRDTELPRDVARTNTMVGLIYNLLANLVGKRAPIHINASKLVDPTMT